jgi:hypothetical protein
MMPGTTGYGRIRTVQLGPDRSLYLTTSNATAKQPTADRILKLTPS